MDKMQVSSSSFILLLLLQIHYGLAAECSIVSVTSPSASTLNIKWNSSARDSLYVLDLRVMNSTSVAPLMLMQSASSTQRLVQGLRAGHVYQVTLSAFDEAYVLVCTASTTTMTVPDKSQITSSQAISSTSITFQWSTVTGADVYILFVEETFRSPPRIYNQTFTSSSGQIGGLTPSTTYDCYIYSSNVAGRGDKSNVRTITTLVQPPTGVTLTPTGKSTARVTWNSVSKVLLYQVAVRNEGNPDKPPVVRNSSSTSMDISSLEPCSTYTVGVSSVNVFLVPGEPSTVTYNTTTIGGVTTVSVDYSCSTSKVTVTWDAVFGAKLYRAVAVDGSEASLNCTSVSTSCQIAELKCGENYKVHVTTISDDCESTSNITATFETVPCAPVHLQTTHECSSNVIVFSWEPTNNTNYYVATAVDNTGKTTECRTLDKMCYFTNVGCGRFYTYKVYAVSSECNSQISEPKTIQTSPCFPSNVKTEADCFTNTLITTWDYAKGALLYNVKAEGNNGETYNCSSSNNTCEITSVPCGEQLSVWIVASNDNCSTDRVLVEAAQTAPCTPINVSASAECSPDSARVNWIASPGTIFYIVLAEDANGNSYHCYSLGTTCFMRNLACGRNYTTKVIGNNIDCNSTASQEVHFMTAPCPPTNIEAIRDCDANQAVIVWQNHQTSGVYTALLEDQGGAQLNCTSKTVNNCTILSLPCGKKYNVTVTYSQGQCQSTSASIGMETVPCGPEDVNATVSCSSDELKVSWSIAVPAKNYTAIVSRAMGHRLSCNSTETRCTVGGLQCESSYTVTVFSITGKCLSLPSKEVKVRTLPCPPTNVTAGQACSPDPVSVSWAHSGNAELFTAVALGSRGHRAECRSNETSCSLPGLQCGEVYSVSVAGADNNCAGRQSNPLSLKTEPCSPSNVTSQVMCGAGAAQVFWTPSSNAVSYNVRATSSGQTLTCSSSSSNCTLSPLGCGQVYKVQVSATDGTCVSNYSTPFRQEQVPCAPENVTAALLCDTNDFTVSWKSSPLPLSYSAVAVPLDGSSPVTCDTNSASCVLTGFHCGQALNISVKASSESCSGPHSPMQTVHTGPCSSQNLTAVIDCGTNSLRASWKASSGASSYTATVTGPNGFSEHCSTSHLTCLFSGLHCATSYAIQVVSQDSLCSSAPIQTSTTTGPCDPVNVTSVLQCGSDTATVSWAKGAGAAAHIVLAQEEGSRQNIFCRSNTTSCQLNQLRCGKVYNLTVLAEDATCNSTGETTGTLMTAPCSPSIQSSTLTCGNSSALLSWTPVAGATSFTANATAGNGHSVSCSSDAASCSLSDLLCGLTYTASVTARGKQCDSPPGPSATITTAPCSPTVTSRQYDCGTSTAVISWSNTAGSSSFLAQVAGDGHRDSCRTTNTSCTFRNLPCGLDFNVTVQAQGAECNSSISAGKSLQTVPCAPENVSATALCSTRSALITWVGNPGAVGHNVTVTGQDGHTHLCHTHSTSCHVTDLHCGETYSVSVAPYSLTCPGARSAASSFRAGLCPPSNVTVSPACGDSAISWTRVAGAELYIATATADGGHNHTCSSNYSSSCNFTDLHCGEIYAVTVVTVDRGCWSEPSTAVTLRTALCPPANLTGHVSCETNTLTLRWATVTEATYVLQWERIGSASPPSQYTTSNTSHSLSNLLCGERYAVRVAAQGADCRSTYSPALQISTAPCQPANLTVRVDCGTNNGNFSWAESSGASFYVVEITGKHGHVASCSSNDTSCAVKLHCGRSYSATLVASTESCNSTKHANIYFDSAPCLPDDVTAELDCNTNVMNVNWTQTTGSDEYTAWAIGTDGHRASCNSTSNSCSIHHLRCGRIYDVAVTSSSINCEVIVGSDYKVQSAPCKAENTTAQLNCSSNAMTVKWQDGGAAQNYTVRAASASGVNSTCDTAESSCSFLDLSCGQLYTFTVTGYTNVCVSDMSDPTERHTAPCPPTSVSANLNCTTRKTRISWTKAAATAATAYSALATSSAGHNASCSDMGSSCYLDQLACGQHYSVVVEAIHAGCPGPASAPVTFATEPCVPMDVSVNYNVSGAWVTWSRAEGAASYSVQGVADSGSSVSCTTNATSCFLPVLLCSRIYNITVTARNQACDSVISDMSNLMTAPCPPTNVQASISCDYLTATVSWQRSVLAVGYVAYLDGQSGHNASCVGADVDTSCVVSGLSCGSVYRVWVKALGKQHNSTKSAVVSLTSGPCQPHSIKAFMDCQTHSATVSWQPSAGAVSYATMLTSSSGHTSSCSTNTTSSKPSFLQCGEKYNITIKAIGEACNSTAHMAGQFVTEPCTPVNLSVHLNGSDAQVSWSTARGSSSYSVLAVTEQGVTAACNSTACNSTASQCSFTGLQCSQIYNVTVQTRNSACNSTVTSAPHRLVTAPCPPTNVQANMSCEQLRATVSWQQSNLAVGYVAYLNNQNGHSTSCLSTNTFCSVSGLMCDTVYRVWVKALGEQYNSSDSSVLYFTSAPCLPSQVAAEVSCKSGTDAIVSWNASQPTNISVVASVAGTLQTLCTTPHGSCNVSGLSCGDTYKLSLIATNEQCSLTAQTHVNVTTRPCTPQRVSVSLQCGFHSALVSWEEKPDVELHTASAVKSSGGELKMCNSSGSSCSFSGLDCGEMYNFTVAAYSKGCWSRSSSPILIHTEPCQPVNVSAQMLCESDEVRLSWDQPGSPAQYSVTAKGSLGFTGAYNTTHRLLSATLPCGQHYNLTVQAQSSDCDGMPSRPFYFRTGPCVPRDVVTSLQCNFNVGSVSWAPSDGAESYIARATGLDGHTHLCTTNTTSCSWTDLHCGEQYKIVVGAKADNCTRTSKTSSTIYMNSCRPQNLAATVNCGMKVVSLEWDVCNGTETYMVSAQTGDTVIRLSTNTTTALFSDFVCGQNYNLTVTPVNRNCPGNPSKSTSVQTWPCLPVGISAKQDCISSIVMVSWDSSNGSEYYTAKVQTDTGISDVCMSDRDACSIASLKCGHNFSVSVTAFNRQCNVTSKEPTSLQTVPCIPTNVSVKVNCSNNSADVSWSPSRGALRYSVLANSSHSDDSCTASDLSCLACGANYTVQVVAMDDRCSSLPSLPVLFESGPCPPHNLNAELSCLSNDLTVTWNAVRDADHFLVHLTAANGENTAVCNTTNTTCSTSSLTCGDTYAVQVTSVRGTCQSEHNQTRSIQSAPCQPQGVRGYLDCVTNSAWISWDSAAGAESYTVLAVGDGAHTANCTSTNTTCEVEDLACGVSYNFTVTAKNRQCESPPSASISLQTAPCSLPAITAFAQCHNSSILVEWKQMRGSAGGTVYVATAEASDQTYLYCNSMGSSCLLRGAKCDLRYTIIVAASSNRCSSLRSPPYRISMEPCAPKDVFVDVSCEDRSALVSWSSSPVAEVYHVVATGADGHEHTCNSTSSNCSMSELHCDQQYTVSVVASHENCTSKASQSATVNTGPCQPSGLSVTLHCDNQSAALTWRPSDNAKGYYGCAQAENGDRLYCHSTGPGCTIDGLVCGTVYNFSVQASDGTCNSSVSDPVPIAGVPCPPKAVEVQLFPMKMGIQVMRFIWTQVLCAETEYLLTLTGRLLGDGQALFEISSYWTNITYFEIPLPCSSSYVATLQSRNAAGTSGKSTPLNGTTAPCPPSGVAYSGNSVFATVSWNSSVFATKYTLYDDSVSPRKRLCSTATLSCSLSNVSSSSLVVTASNAAGESQPANVTEVTVHLVRRRDLGEQTPENGNIPAPLLDVKQPSPSILFLRWSPVEGASFYNLLIRNQGGSDDDQELTVYGESIIVSELRPGSAYCLSVLAVTADMSGPESEPVCVQIGQGIAL
ncbi:serine-rich adhesin for platelets-like [Poeciliopsis prolifica]|uniref:serine-rich adhesin for platelets-like n=1 Tax=Poeciliopsis prolifica TaxID=188132 RepID=UPI0024139FED|nr:serine-rich adhesin for platelets-like [Poeciliopsis prolifica]